MNFSKLSTTMLSASLLTELDSKQLSMILGGCGCTPKHHHHHGNSHKVHHSSSSSSGGGIGGGGNGGGIPPKPLR